ncbi:hypothetical protein NX059_000715 [Plenodomus lindquistii]|nr:hypothetical protein NX059_000715 [Plenodomus lindquistii]
MLLLSIFYVMLSTSGVVFAGFDPSSKTNLAVYWGQNSLGGSDSQQRLSVYCKDPAINIIPIAFVTAMNGPRSQPVLNLANIGNKCNQTQPLTCGEVEDDIKYCQSVGKTILLSLGGGQNSNFNYPDEASAKKGAEKLWLMFGPDQKKSDIIRPFGSAVVDGFDFDFEEEFTNAAAFGRELRELMCRSGKTYYLSVAPICARIPSTGTSIGQDLLDGVQIDMFLVQFYNGGNSPSGCDINGAFNFDKWNSYVKSRNATFLMGLPAAELAAPHGGYVVPEKLKDVFGKTKGLDRMAGAMLWDISRTWDNSMYHVKVKDALKATAVKVRRH